MWERNTIPGYAEAQDSERVDRALAFVPLSELIAGVPCAPLTPLRVEWLRAVNNPYFCEAAMSLSAQMQFLWFVSPEFQPGKAHLEDFLQKHVALDVEALARDIEDYLDRAYLDAPQGANAIPYCEPAASLIFALGQEPFNWSIEKVLTTSLALEFQLLKVRDKARGEIVVNRRSDKMAGDWLARLNGKTKEEKANGG